jgi:hypothetical protein
VRLAGVGLVCLAPALVGTATAAASLVLKSGGAAAPVGTPVRETLRFGPCGTFEGQGTLLVNNSSTDRTKFSSTTGGGGGCGEGGPTISGFLVAVKLTETGHYMQMVNMIYRTQTPHECEYSMRMLTGRFPIPGLTQSTLQGVAKRTATSAVVCEEKIKVKGVEAGLYDSEASALFEAEL